MSKEVLVEQFNRCYDENGWFVSVRKALEGVTAEQAAWKPDGADHSIWQTLAHLSYDVNVYLQRFKGIDFQHTASTNDETFETSENDWQAELAKFDSIISEFRSLLEAAEESKFAEPVLGNESFKWFESIADLNAHNAYHAGQILLIRKLEGSWNPEKGVS
jgi:uncharacterized damage-inducible protein DinB